MGNLKYPNFTTTMYYITILRLRRGSWTLIHNPARLGLKSIYFLCNGGHRGDDVVVDDVDDDRKKDMRRQFEDF